MFSLKKFRKKVKGLADLLKYGALVNEHTILNKDGSFTTMFFYFGEDTASSTPGKFNYITAQVNRALQLLGDGWALHVDAIRTAETFYPTNNHFPDELSQMLDDERKEFFEGKTCYRTQQYLTLTYLPDYNAEKLLASASGNVSKQDKNLERQLDFFEATVRSFADIASSVLYMERLCSYKLVENGYDLQETVTYSHLLSIVHYIITGIFQPIRVPASALYLDALLATQDLVGGVTPKIGDKYIVTLSIDGFPQASYPAMLDILEAAPLEYRFNTRFMFLDKMSAEAELKTYQKSWNQKVFTLLQQVFPNPKAKGNKNASDLVDDAEKAMEILQEDSAGFGYLSSTIVLVNEDLELLEASASDIKKALQNLGFGCRVETVNTLEAWIGSHPGNSYANLRRPLVNTLNLAHLLPLATVWYGKTFNPCSLFPKHSSCLAVVTTDGNTPVYFNIHVGDLGHLFLVGTTGSGKSAFLSWLAWQFMRYAHAKVYCFDKSYSMKILCNALKGSHFDIGKTTDLAFAPLQNIHESDAEIAWAVDWIETLINLQQQEKGITPKQRNFLTASIKELVPQPVNMRSLSHLYDIILSKDPDLAAAIKHYTINGSMGHLLDATSDSLTLADFMTFEIGTLMTLGDKNLVPVLLYLFHRIEKSLKGQPSIIILDEAWVMIGHPLFREKIREWLKMLRKANCAVILATQQITDVTKSDILDVILDSCLSKIYLPSTEITSNKMLRNSYEVMGLNDQEINIIATAVTKRQYYLKTPEGSRLIDLNLLPKSLAFIGHSDPESIAQVDELMQKNPDNWQEEWMKIQGVM